MRKQAQRWWGVLLVTCVLVGTAGAAPGDNPVEDWVRYTLTEMELAPVACAGEPTVMIRRCADVPRSYSRFKATWDSVQGRFDVPATLDAVGAWTRRQDRYVRTYEVEGVVVQVQFGDGQLVFEYDPEQLQDLGFVLEPDQVGYVPSERKAPPRLAGFGGVTRPEVIEHSRVAPVYPADALTAMLRGQVRLNAVILADGTLGEVHVVDEKPEGHGFGESALAAVRWWRFRPAMLDGEAVDAEYTLTVEFDPAAAPAADGPTDSNPPTGTAPGA